MNNTLLLQQFDLLATAPGGVAQLRELILTLAVQGKLVPQDPADEPASALLKRIRAEKDRLIAEKKIRRSKPLDAVADDETQFELPRGWAWERLGNLGDWGAGATPSRSTSSYYGGHISWFKSGELTADFIFESEETVTEDALKNCSLRLNQVGDVLVAMYGATIGKTAILSVVGTTNQAVCACTPFSGLQNTYLLLFLKAMKPYLISIGTGGAQPNISREKIISVVIALPPLPEQARIVARVEELMRVCDALEATGQRQAAHHRQLVQTLFGQLTAAPDDSAPPNPPDATPPTPAPNHPAQPHPTSPPPAATPNPWQRVAAHFDTLLDRPSAVDALEQTILQLAVRGQLVPQDPTDEPASQLLKRIRAEKDRLIAAGKIKRDKPLAPIAEDEQPFELPMGWEWVRFGVLPFSAHTGLDRGRDLQNDAFAFPYFKMNNISNGGGSNFANMARVDATPEELDRFRLVIGDFLFNTRNSRDLVGKSCVIDSLPEENTIFNNNILVSRFRGQIEAKYLDTWFRSPIGQERLSQIKSATTNVCAIYQGNLFDFLCPLPPLPEQARIVARVAHLRRLCADLRQRLSQSKTTQAALADALVAEAGAGVAGN
jgi:type I restriction enzyme, S subunit